MKPITKNRSIGIAAAFASLIMLGGCASTHPSTAWQGRGYDAGSAGSSSALVFTPQQQTQSSNANTLVFSGTYQAPEYGRLDHTLSTRDLSRRDEMFGIPSEPRPSLNNRRTFRTSRNADEYTYPSTEARNSRGYRNNGSYRRYRRD